MKLEIKKNTLIFIFTLIGILFFTGFINYIVHILAGGGTKDLATDIAGNPLKKVLGMSILLVCLFLSIRYKLLLNFNFVVNNKWVIIFVLYVLFSFLWSVEPSITVRRSIFFLSVIAFSCYLTRLYTIETIFTTIGYLIGLFALLGLIRAVIDPGNAFISGGIREGAFLGIFPDKNGGARAYVFAIMFLFPRVFVFERKALIASSLCTICLLLSGSASGILMLAIGGATYLFLSKLSSGNSSLKSYIFGSFIYCIGTFLFYQSSQFILYLLGRNSDLTNRTIIWELLTPLIQDKFVFGYGFGAFWPSSSADEFVQRWSYIGNAHNGYVEMMLHGGVVFLLLFIILVVVTIKKLILNASKGNFTKYQHTSIAILIQLLFVNFVAYSLPNHNAIDFFIFSTIIFFSSITYAKQPK